MKQSQTDRYPTAIVYVSIPCTKYTFHVCFLLENNSISPKLNPLSNMQYFTFETCAYAMRMANDYYCYFGKCSCCVTIVPLFSFHSTVGDCDLTRFHAFISRNEKSQILLLTGPFKTSGNRLTTIQTHKYRESKCNRYHLHMWKWSSLCWQFCYIASMKRFSFSKF